MTSPGSARVHVTDGAIVLEQVVAESIPNLWLPMVCWMPWGHVLKRVAAVDAKKLALAEGCMSFPGQSVKVTQAFEVRVAALDVNGEEREIIADGMYARCIQ